MSTVRRPLHIFETTSATVSVATGGPITRDRRARRGRFRARTSRQPQLMATSRRTWSPASWPWVPLNSRKLSTSTSASASGAFARRAISSRSASAATDAPWFSRPVTGRAGSFDQGHALAGEATLGRPKDEGEQEYQHRGPNAGEKEHVAARRIELGQDRSSVTPDADHSGNVPSPWTKDRSSWMTRAWPADRGVYRFAVSIKRAAAWPVKRKRGRTPLIGPSESRPITRQQSPAASRRWTSTSRGKPGGQVASRSWRR